MQVNVGSIIGLSWDQWDTTSVCLSVFVKKERKKSCCINLVGCDRCSFFFFHNNKAVSEQFYNQHLSRFLDRCWSFFFLCPAVINWLTYRLAALLRMFCCVHPSTCETPLRLTMCAEFHAVIGRGTRTHGKQSRAHNVESEALGQARLTYRNTHSSGSGIYRIK